MRLLLDEDSGAHSLLAALRADGHDVARVVDVAALGAGARDDDVLAYAIDDKRTLVTKNGADFADLIEGDEREHYGVLVVHYRQDGSALPIAVVAKAITTISEMYSSVSGMLLSVNQHVW